MRCEFGVRYKAGVRYRASIRCGAPGVLLCLQLSVVTSLVVSSQQLGTVLTLVTLITVPVLT